MSPRRIQSRPSLVVAGLLAVVIAVVALVLLLSGGGRRDGPGRLHGGATAGAASGSGRSGGGARSGSDREGRGDEDEPRTGSAVAGSAPDPRVSLAGPAESVLRTTWEGKVLDESTKAPVPGATVTLADPERSVEARTDEEGDFGLAWFEDAPARLRVEHPDYVDLFVAEVDLEARGEFALRRSAKILGLLTPAPEEEARALAWHQAASSHRYWAGFEAEVEDDGRFVIADLTPGQYAVTARVPGRTAPIEVGLNLEPGDELDVRLEVSAGGTLRGKVVRAGTYEPVPGVDIHLRPGGKRLPPMFEELRSTSLTSGAGGSYEVVGLAPGAYRYVLMAEQGDVVRGMLEVPADGLRLEHDFELPGPARLSGRVVDSGGAAVPGARVVAFAMGDTKRTLSARTGEFDEDTLETRAGPDGGFELSTAPTGRVLVVLAYPPDFDPEREKSAAPASLVLKQLEPGQVLGGLVLQIPPGERISGSVRSSEGEALSGVQVSAQRFFGERYVSLGIVETDASGRFSIHPLLPGKYRVLATTELFWTTIEVTEVDGGIEAEVELVLEPKLSVRGIARSAEGAGIPNLPVRFRLDEEVEEELEVQAIERPTTVYGRTDAFGRFEVSELHAGPWSVHAGSYGWKLVLVDPEVLHVPDDGFVELTLEPREERRERFSITGVVALADGGIPTGVRIEGLRGGFLEIDGGEFRATGLVPTRHHLWISADGHARTRVARIDPVPGGTVDLGRIELLPTTVLTVKVETADGKAIDDARVSLDPLPAAEGGSPLGRRLVLSPVGQGRYRTKQSTRHAWRLRVRHEEFRNASRRVDIRDQPRQSLQIVLQ